MQRYLVPAALTLVLAIGAACGQGPTPPAAQAGAVWDTTTTTEAPTTTTTVDTELVAMLAWASTIGAPDANTLSGIDDALAAASGSGSVSTLGAACRTALPTIHTLQGHTAAPDPALDLAWSKALSLTAQGLDSCIRAARTSDVDLLEQSTEYITQSTEAIQEATAILSRYV